MVVAETPRLTYTHVTAVISVIKLIMEILKKSVKVYVVGMSWTMEKYMTL